jgi:hypothetical protein
MKREKPHGREREQREWQQREGARHALALQELSARGRGGPVARARIEEGGKRSTASPKALGPLR